MFITNIFKAATFCKCTFYSQLNIDVISSKEKLLFTKKKNIGKLFKTAIKLHICF